MTRLDDGWQAALSAEQQAAFGYPLLGPQLAGAQRQQAADCATAHQGLCETTAAALTAAGRTPVAAAPDYPALYPVPDAAAARALAVRLEEACAGAWRYLFLLAAGEQSGTARQLRGAAQQALTGSAVRAAGWRRLVTPSRPTTPFPGS